LWAVSEEACCPFKHHSQASIHQLLQPNSGVALHKIHHLVDVGDYSGACHLYLNSLISESKSHDGDHDQTFSPSATVKSSACETLCSQYKAHQQNDMEVEQTSDSGYDSAQSYQPVQNSCISASSIQNSESYDAQNCVVSLAHQQSSSAVVSTMEPEDCGICNVQEHIIGSNCDTVAHKLHAPVDFYASFNCLVAGLYSHAVP